MVVETVDASEEVDSIFVSTAAAVVVEGAVIAEISGRIYAYLFVLSILNWYIFAIMARAGHKNIRIFALLLLTLLGNWIVLRSLNFLATGTYLHSFLVQFVDKRALLPAAFLEDDSLSVLLFLHVLGTVTSSQASLWPVLETYTSLHCFLKLPEACFWNLNSVALLLFARI